MTDPTEITTAGASIALWFVVAAAGLTLGRLLTLAVARLMPRASTRSRMIDRAVEAAAVATAIGLWWWEMGGGPSAPAAGDPVLGRYLAHLLLFTLLAAASWVDLRERVIPDAITVPGVLIGLAWISFLPTALMPIICPVPRSFAPPQAVPDVLGLWGGLQAAPAPSWLGPSPAASGLLAALAAFAAWWLAGTAPAPPSVAARERRSWRLLIEPRLHVAVVGMVVIVAAWLRGGAHWGGTLASLAGMLVAGGMIWLTRVGASRALGREALGFGDVTLMAMVGAWLGWQPCVVTCVLAVFIGLMHGLALKIVHRESELPFGPSLCLAAAVVVVAWEPIWERAAPAFERPVETAAVVVAVIVLTAASLWIWQRWRGG